ncbi:MAG: CvpA family protein [Candidatus Delongbacteria bacterium]|nr:CvpA family protein [Candidatus Delongbacteria bacterium]MCG2760737.1 CvpA family protein [Candidatus Delongbacteria bacterium]
MIFDIILIIMLIVTVTRAGVKGCTEDLNFTIGFLIIIRIAGAFYVPVSKILSKFIENENYATYAAYFLLLLVIFFFYNSLIGRRIIEFGKKVPKTTGRLLTYLFAAFKTIIIFSILFSFVYTLPVLKKLPEKYITPKTFGLTYGIMGTGTENLLQNLASYLQTLNNPIEYFEKQKAKQTQASKTGLDAIRTHEGLKDFIKDEKEKPKTNESDKKEPEKKEE